MHGPVECKPFIGDGGAGDVAPQVLEFLPLMGGAAHLGTEAKPCSLRQCPLRVVVTGPAGLPMAGSAQGPSRPAPAPAQAATEKSRSPSAYWWATLLARIYEVFPLRCPRCGEPMRLIAAY